MSLDSKHQKPIIDEIAKFGEGYPDYATLMTKAIQPNKPRWFDVAYQGMLKEHK